MLGPFERRQPTVGFLHRNDEFVAKGSSFRLRLGLIYLASLPGLTQSLDLLIIETR